MAVLRAAFFARVQRLHAFGKRLGRKARPRVLYGEHRTARAVRGAPHMAFQRYCPAPRRVARGILHKIHQRTQQLRPAHGQHGRSIRQQAKYTAPRPAESLALGLYLGQELRQGNATGLSGLLREELEEKEMELDITKEDLEKVKASQSAESADADELMKKYKELENSFFDIQMENLQLKNELDKLRKQEI